METACFGGVICFGGGDGFSSSGVGGLTILRGGVESDFWASRNAVSSRIVLNSPEVIVRNVSSVVTVIVALDITGKLDINISPKTGLSRNSASESRRFITSGTIFSGTGGGGSRSSAGAMGFVGSGIVTARGMRLGCRSLRSLGLKAGDCCGEGGSSGSGTGA